MKQELSSQVNFSPISGKSGLILNSKDKGRRSEADNDGEVYALVYQGRSRAFSLREQGATPFLSFFGP